jgi:DNA (cytosine-5)-methyltransferase 1
VNFGDVMRHGSLFSGIGGFDLAATWMGWENVFQCEKDIFCQRILRFYWPKARMYENIKEFDATVYRGAITVLSGGFPCQPFSVAGKRKGTADDRYLWPEMCRIINEVRPRWVVGENVLGLLNWGRGMVFEHVHADLEAAGYEVWTYILPAAGIGAPHLRQRVWIVAYAGGDGCGGYPAASKIGNRGDEKGLAGEHDADALPGSGISADTYCAGWKGRFADGFRDLFETAAAFSRGESARGTAAPDWEGFPTQSPFCTGDDGISDRLDGIAFLTWRYKSLRGAGNAIVPGIALRIFQVIERMEKYRTDGI